MLCVPQSTNWKRRIAPELRSRSTATKAGIAQRLAMDHPTRVGNQIRDMEAGPFPIERLTCSMAVITHRNGHFETFKALVALSSDTSAMRRCSTLSLN